MTLKGFSPNSRNSRSDRRFRVEQSVSLSFICLDPFLVDPRKDPEDLRDLGLQNVRIIETFAQEAGELPGVDPAPTGDLVVRLPRIQALLELVEEIAPMSLDEREDANR